MKLNAESAAEEKNNLRDEYLLEKVRIMNEFGGLRQMREILGLSQRRLCRLLLVDPSAWTRWNKTDAPPHIYQALKWLIELKKVNPDIVGPSDLHKRVDDIQISTHRKISDLEHQVSMLERTLAMQATVTPAPVFSTDTIELKLALKLEQLQQQIRELTKAKNKPKSKSHPKLKPRRKVKTSKKKAKVKPKSVATRKKTKAKIKRKK